MAARPPAVVEQGLAIKKVGNQLISALGGRPVHPVSVRVGGFSRVPRRAGPRRRCARTLDAGRRAWSQATVGLVASWDPPDLEHPQPLVALRHPTEYPYNDGRIVSTDGLDLAPGAWGDAFEEHHLEGTNALHARTHDGRVYLLGPDRADHARRRPAAPARRRGPGGHRACRDAIRTNIHRSIVARAVELLDACAEARDIIDGYRPPPSRKVPFTPRAGVAAWSTEAPRGLLHHRYEVDEQGHVTARPDRAADQPEPGSHRGGPRGLRPERPRPAPRRGHPPPRDADPGLRPVHQLRDPLPRSPDRGAGTRARRSVTPRPPPQSGGRSAAPADPPVAQRRGVPSLRGRTARPCGRSKGRPRDRRP